MVDVSRYLPWVPENLAHRPKFTTLTSFFFNISFISYNRHFSIIGLLRLSTFFVDVHKTAFQLEMRQSRGQRVIDHVHPQQLPDIPRPEWVERA